MTVEVVVDIAVIGAGPKAAALAAKVHVLNALGLASLELVVIEHREFAAAWTGRHGYTTGAELLGTRPEKDVGFPYQSVTYGAAGRAVDAAMTEFSWQAYLVQHGDYQRWVDLGTPPPSHDDFARYLAWVLAKTHHGVRVVRAEAMALRACAEGWQIECGRQAGESVQVRARGGLVVTGTGMVRHLPCDPDVRDLVMSADRRGPVPAAPLGARARICLVGAGESAASMALHLIDTLGPDIELTFVAPSLPHMRAESYLENSVYSNSLLARWEHLPLEVREQFIRRTDRGVMSGRALERLAQHRHIAHVLGRVRRVGRSANGCLAVVIDQADEVVRADFDAVVNCTGFDPLLPVIQLLGQERAAVEEAAATDLADCDAVALRLDRAFALRGVRPRLHIPALAALLYGPGYSNLSCLGSMAERVLDPYVTQRAHVSGQESGLAAVRG